MRIAYFDCIAGISGDMALGSLVDAGVDFDELRAILGKLPLEPFSLEREEVESFAMPNSTLWTLYEQLQAHGEQLSIRKVNNRNEIYPIFRDLFQRRAAPQKVSA